MKSTLSFSPLSNRIFYGRVNEKTGVASGSQKDVTSEFLYCMEQKFPVNTVQTITVNGVAMYRIFVVDMVKDVIVNGKLHAGNNK